MFCLEHTQELFLFFLKFKKKKKLQILFRKKTKKIVKKYKKNNIFHFYDYWSHYLVNQLLIILLMLLIFEKHLLKKDFVFVLIWLRFKNFLTRISRSHFKRKKISTSKTFYQHFDLRPLPTWSQHQRLIIRLSFIIPFRFPSNYVIRPE